MNDFPRWAREAPACFARGLLQQGVLFPAVDAICRPLRVDGREHLAGLRPPFLLVANHTSHLDTPVILRALPPDLCERVAVAAAADYFYTRGASALLVTTLLNAFPLARRGALRPSLAYCAELLADGWAVLLFPEGTRSPTGALQPFKRGIGLLAAEFGVPVVPVHLAGLHDRLPKGARWPRPGPAAVRFGAPLHVAAGTSHADTAAHLEAAVRSLAIAART